VPIESIDILAAPNCKNALILARGRRAGSGVFVEGAHFFRKPGLGPRWKREALVRWLEDRELEGPGSTTDDVPLATSTRDAVRWA
jgi:hypothetical protein